MARGLEFVQGLLLEIPVLALCQLKKKFDCVILFDFDFILLGN